jgi:hypothetical protein
MPVSSLSPELFTEVFEYLLLDSPPSSLINCLLCCKAWRNIAEPLLYRDIVLKYANINKYLLSRTETDNYVRTLTLRVYKDYSDEMVDAELHAAGLEIEGYEAPFAFALNDLVGKKLKHMHQLTSAAIIVPPKSAKVIHFIFLISPLVKFLDSLPPTCISLEIDTRGCNQHSLYDTNIPNLHLCSSIRRLLPQLRYLRVRSRFICPSICGTGYKPGSSRDEVSRNMNEFKPSHAPKLQVLIISIAIDYYAGTELCYPSGLESLQNNTDPSHVTGQTMAKYLGLLVESKSLPSVKKLWLVALKQSDKNDRASFPAYLQLDMLTNRTQTLPHGAIYGKYKGQGVFVRMSEGNDVAVPIPSLEILVEGKLWQETSHGLRLPQPLMARTIYMPIGPSLLSPEELQRRQVRVPLWEDEEKTGVRLLEAEQLPGLKMNPVVRSRRPEGWRRVGGRLKPART